MTTLFGPANFPASLGVLELSNVGDVVDFPVQGLIASSFLMSQAGATVGGFVSDYLASDATPTWLELEASLTSQPATPDGSGVTTAVNGVSVDLQEDAAGQRFRH